MSKYIGKLEKLTKRIYDIKSESTLKLSLIEEEFNNVLNEIREYERSQEIENQYDLTKSKDVVSFLKIARESLRRFRKDGRFKEEVHFKYDENKRVKYIPAGIIKFKKTYVKNERKIKSNKGKDSKKIERESTLNHLNNKMGRAA